MSQAPVSESASLISVKLHQCEFDGLKPAKINPKKDAENSWSFLKVVTWPWTGIIPWTRGSPAQRVLRVRILQLLLKVSKLPEILGCTSTSSCGSHRPFWVRNQHLRELPKPPEHPSACQGWFAAQRSIRKAAVIRDNSCNITASFFLQICGTGRIPGMWRPAFPSLGARLSLCGLCFGENLSAFLHHFPSPGPRKELVPGWNTPLEMCGCPEIIRAEGIHPRTLVNHPRKFLRH